ncbi:MAG: MMPL family transporter [Thermoplasmatota archaeon]
MLTERVGKFTTRFPWIGIALILVVTLSAFAIFQIKGMESSFEQEDFLPDIEVARANSLYSETFSSNYVFIVLIRSPDGDVVTRDGFLDMIELTERIMENQTYKKYRDPASSETPMSPANSLYQMRTSRDQIEDLIEVGNALSSYDSRLGPLNSSVSSFRSNISETGDLNETAMINDIEELSTTLKDFLEQVSLPELDERTYNSSSSYISGLESDQRLKDEIKDLISYDLSDPAIGTASMDSLVFTSSVQMPLMTIGEAIGALDDLEEEKARLSNSTLVKIDEIRTQLQDTKGRLSQLAGMGGSFGNPLAMGQITNNFNFGMFVVLNFLTEDFDLSGDAAADGAMIIVNLDYSLIDMRDTNLSGLRSIETGLANIVKEFDDTSDLEVHPIGQALIDEKINDAMNESMQILLPLALLFVLVILWMIYRNIFDIVLNILALGFAIIWMYGFGSLAGFSMNPMIMAVPVLLVGLGIDYGIHLTMRYREEIRKGRSVKEAILGMSRSVGMALLLATFTTVFAFLSNLFSPVGLIMQFGVMSAVGIISSFLIMLIFVPSVKRIRDVRRARKNKTLFLKFREGECDLCMKEVNRNKLVNKALLGLTIRAEKHPVIILVVVGLLTAGMFTAALNSEITFDINDFLPDGLQESRDLSYILTEFRLGGSGDFGIVLIEGDVADPLVLRAMDETMENILNSSSDYISIEGEGAVARVKSDFILYSMKDMALMFGIIDPSSPFVQNYSRYFDFDSGLPMDTTTKDEVKLVFDKFYDLAPSLARKVIHRVEGEYTMSAIAITVYTDNDREAWKLYDELEEYSAPLENLEGGSLEKVTITGGAILLAVMIKAMQESQVSSLVITIIVSLVVLTIVFFVEERSLILGSVATLPVAFCVIWIVGTMYLVGIPLNVMTITIGALTVGLGITYGIHITHRFVEDVRVEEDLMEASKNTLMNTGSALFGAAATTVAGFGLLTFATMPPLQQFGQVTALAIIYSFISSVIVLPVLLIIWAKGRTRWRKRTGRDIFNGKEKE